MPRQTNFRINQEQEEKLNQYLSEKYESVRQDNSDRVRIDTESFERYMLDVNRRKGIATSIYPLSNIPIPVYAMCIDNVWSRIENATNGDEPYIKFQAVGNEDETKAQIYTDYFSWKLEQGGVHKSLLDTQLATVLQCGQISKATYDKDEIYWTDFETPILHDQTTGNPVETITSGPVIHGEDEWQEMPDPIGVLGQLGNAMGMDVQPTMRQHLKSDPSLVFDPAKHYWAPAAGGVRRSQVLFSGAKSENVRFDRFYCAMDAASIHESDCMELEDRTLDWFRSMWWERPWASWAMYEPQLKSGDASAKTNDTMQNMGTGQPTLDKKPENRVYDHINPVRRVAEFWIKRDVLGDGKLPPQDFVCFWDIDLKMIVWLEWTAKVCPDMKRPYSVCSLVKEPNRWCGQSIWKRGREIFNGIDRLFNGIFYRTLQQSNPPKGGDPGAAKEEPTDIAYDPTKYYELNKDRTIDELISYAKVPDTNQRSDQVMNFLISSVQLWLAVSNLQQGDLADVPQNNTATGIDQATQDASIQRRSAIRRKLEADEEHLTKLVKIIIATIQKDEVYEFEDGDVRKAMTILAADVRKLNMHVTVREQQRFREIDIKRCKAGWEAVAPYFQQLNPEVRKIMLPFVLEILHNLGFHKAEEQLVEFEGIPMDAKMGGALEMGPEGQPQLPQAEPPAASLNQPPPPPVKGSISVQAKWEQLPPEVRAQLMGELGIKDNSEGNDVPAPKAPEPHPAQLAADAKNAKAKKPAATK